MEQKKQLNTAVHNSYRTFEQAPLLVNLEDDNSIHKTKTNKCPDLVSTSVESVGSVGSASSIGSNVSACGLAAGQVSAPRAIFMISNAALGAGLLNFPEAYMKAGGIRVALSLQFVMLVFIIGAFSILSKCADKHQAGTYQAVIAHLLGNRATQFIQVCIVFYFLGTCITYSIIIGEQLASVVQFATGTSEKVDVWYTNRKILMIIFAVVFLLPLCLQRCLKLLSYTSCFGAFGAVFITSIIMRNYYVDEYRPHPKVELLKHDWTSAFHALPCLCFGFQCHVSSVVVYSELRNRSRTKFFACAAFAMILCATAYSLCGAYGYSTFGAQTHPDILTNYNYNDVLVSVARVSVLLILLTSFSIQAFCARNVITEVTVKIYRPGSELARRVCITIGWFLIVLLLAFIVPNISVAIGIVSGIAALFIFVFPGLCLLRAVDLDQDLFEPKDLIVAGVALLYVMLGCFIFGLVIVMAFQQAARIAHHHHM